jgi:hypothetical protein
MTYGELKRLNEQQGGVFFSEDTMRYWKTRLLGSPQERNGYFLFVTSDDLGLSSGRQYTLRMSDTKGAIRTVERFPTRAQAFGALARHSAPDKKTGI